VAEKGHSPQFCSNPLRTNDYTGADDARNVYLSELIFGPGKNLSFLTLKSPPFRSFRNFCLGRILF